MRWGGFLCWLALGLSLSLSLACDQADDDDTTADDDSATDDDAVDPCPSPPPSATPEALIFEGDCEVWSKITGLYFIEDGGELWGLAKASCEEDERPRGKIRPFRSQDGLTWTEDVECLIGIGEEDTYRGHGIGTPSVLDEDGTYRVWYRVNGPENVQSIALAESDDGCEWTISDQPVWPPEEAWANHAVIAPHVLSVEGAYRMYYGGSNFANQMSSDIGLAVSEDGVVWASDPGNPIFERAESGWDRSLLAGPHAWQEDGRWLMLYAGHSIPTEESWEADLVGWGQEIGLAASWDGHSWTRCYDDSLLSLGIKADSPFTHRDAGGTWVYFRTTFETDGSGGLMRRVYWPDWPSAR